MESVVIILRNSRNYEHLSKVLFINAVDLVTRDKSVSYLSEEHQEEIISIYKLYNSKPGVASVDDVEDIAKNDWSLSIPLYVTKLRNEIDSKLSLKDSYEIWSSAGERNNEAKRNVIDYLANQLP